MPKRQKELELKEQEIASKDSVIAGNEQALAQAKDDAAKLEAQLKKLNAKERSFSKAMQHPKKSSNCWPKIYRTPKKSLRNWLN